ncbi:MAG TPA: hypothetical protein P5513_07695 [Candidatus Diapherotrites archaeon]|nr:hypothetical protein [Candidatus Diapherotrites archaeon]
MRKNKILIIIILFIIIPILLINNIIYADSKEKKEEPDYIIKIDDFKLNIYFSKHFLGMYILLMKNYDNIRFINYEINEYYKNNVENKLNIEILSDKNFIKSINKTYNALKKYCPIFYAMLNLPTEEVKNFVKENDKIIEEFRKYIMQIYIEYYIKYLEYILNKYIKYINIKGEIDLAFLYPFDYIPENLNNNFSEEFYLSNDIINKIRLHKKNDLGRNEGHCIGNWPIIIVYAENKYKFCSLVLHELTHAFIEINNIHDILHEYYLNDPEIDPLIREFSKLLDLTKENSKSDSKIDFFNFIFSNKDSAATRRNYFDSSKKLIFINLYEGFPRIMESLYLVTEFNNIDNIKNEIFFSYIFELNKYKYLMKFVEYLKENGFFNDKINLEDTNLYFMWYNIFKEYIKYIIKNNGLEIKN